MLPTLGVLSFQPLKSGCPLGENSEQPERQNDQTRVKIYAGWFGE
jgi:hypothetical protein